MFEAGEQGGSFSFYAHEFFPFPVMRLLFRECSMHAYAKAGVPRVLLFRAAVF